MALNYPPEEYVSSPINPPIMLNDELKVERIEYVPVSELCAEDLVSLTRKQEANNVYQNIMETIKLTGNIIRGDGTSLPIPNAFWKKFKGKHFENLDVETEEVVDPN